MRQPRQSRDARRPRDACEGVHGAARRFADGAAGKFGGAVGFFLQNSQPLMRFSHEDLVQAAGKTERAEADLICMLRFSGLDGRDVASIRNKPIGGRLARLRPEIVEMYQWL